MRLRTKRKGMNIFFLICDLTLLILVGLVIFSCVANYLPTGWRFVLVEGISMKPFYFTGDIVVVKEDPNRETIKIGDILSYTNKETGGGIVHRVIDIKRSSDLSFLLKGDNNRYEDGWIAAGDIIGKIVYSLKTRYIYSYPSLIFFLFLSLFLFLNNKYKSHFRDVILPVAVFLFLKLLFKYFEVYTSIYPDLVPW